MRIVPRLGLAFAVLLATFGAPGLEADEGSIPIVKQTIITAPGRYVVTRDFSYATDAGVLIQANNVTLDLNGHTITGSVGCGGANPANVWIDSALATKGIVIRNGRLVSGCNGIVSSTTSRVSVWIERVEVSGPQNTGIFLGAVESLDLHDSHVHNVGSFSGIQVSGSTAAFQGSISDNIVEHIPQTAITITGMVAGEVRHNVVSDYGSDGSGQDGIVLTAGALAWGAGGNLVEGNTVSALPSGIDDDGIRVNDASPSNLILNNVVKGCRHGIFSYADGTRIERNVVSSNNTNGILIGSGGTGSFNHLEENQTQANTGAGACGIRFQNGNGHVFRNNNLRNNTTGVCNGTLGTNTDAGGNIL